MKRITVVWAMCFSLCSVAWGQAWTNAVVERVNKEHDTTKSFLDYLQPEINKCMGSKAPDFAFWDCGSQIPCQLSQFAGKTVVLTFWSTTCRGCRDEIPELNRLRDSRHGKNVAILWIGWQDLSTIGKFLRQNPLFGRVGIVTPDSLGRPFTFAAHPLSFIIDCNGTLRDNWLGPLKYEAILSRLTPIMTD
jgi:thiol-disulfide isomerase/thioredoxin